MPQPYGHRRRLPVPAWCPAAGRRPL